MTDKPVPTPPDAAQGKPLGREWLVIEDSMKNAVFASEEARTSKGYFPRDVAEKLLGRDLGGAVWFTREESALMRAHPEWRDTEPPTATGESGLRECPWCATNEFLRVRVENIDGWVGHVECQKHGCDDMRGPMSAFKHGKKEDAELDAIKVWNTRPSRGEAGDEPPFLMSVVVPPELNQNTRDMLRGFVAALGKKLRKAEVKYGYSDGWMQSDWREKCQADLVEHLAKGDPRDVAIYAAFLHAHGWPSIFPDGTYIAGRRVGTEGDAT